MKKLLVLTLLLSVSQSCLSASGGVVDTEFPDQIREGVASEVADHGCLDLRQAALKLFGKDAISLYEIAMLTDPPEGMQKLYDALEANQAGQLRAAKASLEVKIINMLALYGTLGDLPDELRLNNGETIILSPPIKTRLEKIQKLSIRVGLQYLKGKETDGPVQGIPRLEALMEEKARLHEEHMGELAKLKEKLTIVEDMRTKLEKEVSRFHENSKAEKAELKKAQSELSKEKIRFSKESIAKDDDLIRRLKEGMTAMREAEENRKERRVIEDAKQEESRARLEEERATLKARKKPKQSTMCCVLS